MLPGVAPVVELLASDCPSSHSSTVYGTSALVAGAMVVPLRDAPHDVQVALGEPVLEAALVAKAPDERVDERRPERRRQLEALDGDRLAQAHVRAPVDDAEPALADEAVDAKLAVEHLADEAERVRGRRHASNDTSSRAAVEDDAPARDQPVRSNGRDQIASYSRLGPTPKCPPKRLPKDHS